MRAPFKGIDWVSYGMKMPDTTSLRGMRILVVGGGPCGLTAAILAKSYGADVTLYEKTGNPLKGNTGYKLRSFNFTLNDVGRAELGDWRSWAGGITLAGRAAHHQNSITYASFTGGRDGLLTSIPRNTFRRNLAQQATKLGVHQHYHTHVTRIDPQTASIWTDRTGSQPITGDLVIVADGLHSTIDKHAGDTAMRKITDPYRYVTATVPLRDLSPKHIHFWHQEGTNSYTVGIPNRGRTITLLLFSLFTDIDSAHPFATPRKAITRLKQEFAQIYTFAPHIANELGTRPVGSFHYKESNRIVLGPRMVAIGDAVGTRPPWAGFGTNVALHSAGTLLRCIITHGGDIAAALPHFEKYHIALAKLVRDYTINHGKFLSRQVASRPEKNSRDALAELTQIARKNLAEQAIA